MSHTGRIQLGMVGGGNDAFIGGMHRIAARIDDRFELVAGALSSTPENPVPADRRWGLTAYTMISSRWHDVRPAGKTV